MTKGHKSTTGDSEVIKGELVKQLANILEETDLSEIEYDTGSLRIRVSRQRHETAIIVPSNNAIASPSEPSAPATPGPAASSTDPASHPGAVKAPMVGVAYLAAEPDTPPYIKVGDKVTEGQTLMLIEAMKTFNPVRAPKAGTISEILVSDGQPIEFDQPLVTIE